MRCDFNKIFNPNFRQEDLIQVKAEIERYKFSSFFPCGIAAQKRYFTPSELVDVYIKGNHTLYLELKRKGFGDEDFGHSKTEWTNAVLYVDKWYGSPQDMLEKQNAFAMLVSAYLDIDKKLASIGLAAFTNIEILNMLDIERLISYFEELTMNFNLYLYYRFFAQLERIRQSSYELSELIERGTLGFNSYAEERASCLKTIQNAKSDLKTLALQIEACSQKASEFKWEDGKNEQKH